MRFFLVLLLFSSLVSCSTSVTRGPSNSVNCSEAVELILKSKRTTLQKARAINDLEGSVKGSFSEIGAGQGISAKFFEAKRASETIVKSISAYGKEESDRLYGTGVRYVSEQRLDQMLEVEFSALKGLKSQFKKDVKLFSLVNTVTTNVDGSGHGWMGIRFADMSKPSRTFQDIKIHLNFGKSNLEDQHKELGKLGVNLVYYLFGGTSIPKNSDELVEFLLDGVRKNIISLDSIEWLKGMRKIGTPAIDLVDSEASDFVIFDGIGKTLTGKDLFFRKNVFAFVDGSGEEVSSTDLNLRMIDWPKLLKKFSNNKEKAISFVRSRIRKGDHVVLLGKKGQKKFLESLSSSMNTSNKILLAKKFLASKSPSFLKAHLLKMSQNKLTPVVGLEDLESLSKSRVNLIRDLESRGLLLINHL
jgi:hypothetical protein